MYRCNLGKVQKDLNMFDDARISFNRGLALDPEHALLMENISELEKMSPSSEVTPSPQLSGVPTKVDVEVEEYPTTSNSDLASSVSSKEEMSDEPIFQDIDLNDQSREPVPPPLKLPELPKGAPPSDRISFVTCSTTKGPIVIAVYSGWAPLGADRFLSLVQSGFFNSTVFRQRH